MVIKMKTTRFKFRGTFDFDRLYKTGYNWLQEDHFNLIEDMYKHKPPAEVEIKYHGEKKVTGYIMYMVHLRFYSQQFKQIEVVKDGKKKKMIEGRIFVETTMEVHTDYEKLWSSSPIKERLKVILEKYILLHDIDTMHADYLWYRVQELNEKLKAAIGMTSHRMAEIDRPESYDEELKDNGE